MWGSGRYPAVVTVTGLARKSAVSGLDARAAGTRAASCRPIWPDAACRPGCSTPEARLAPIVPARWLVKMTICGLADPAAAALRPARSAARR